MASCSANTLHQVVDWMCNDHDIDMSKRDGGGSYDTSAFKKFVRSQARESQMLKTGGGDELKPNAAEILALSKMNEVPQRDPIDYHELATIVVDGVEYVLLDQIVDFMKSGGEDKNLIHEALHEVTEETIAAAQVVDVECVKDRTLDLVSGTPVSRWNIFEVVEELTVASTDVDRRRKRKCGWQMLVAEHDTARTHTTDTTVQDTGGTVSLADVRTVLKNPAANSATVHGGFREWTLPPRHPSRDFNEGLEQASQQEDDVEVPCDEKGDAQTGPQQENPTSSESGKSVSENKGDEVGEEYDPYWDVKRGGGQGSKGWCHAILRLARVFSKPHPLIHVVDKVATPDGRRISHITRNSTERSALAADMTRRRGKRSRTTRMWTTEEKTNVGDDSVAEVTIDSNQEKTISTKQENSERSKVQTQKVDKGASHTEKRPQATTREGEEATERTVAKCTIVTMEAMLERWEHLSQKDSWYNRMYLAATRGTIRSADLGHAESSGKTTQTKKGENASSSSDKFEVVDETNKF
ncbi:hypothetical protein CBR_g50692 [Chara braunii]|uniref:Uncharacterized protein n=1 Tax=Chara braunii TaxID=69332 RepID=A0A388M7E2_CHABU|nr:hypothetical protein CBR_g50692 [Chara braunii]|eukprot:GBG90446.1 hypothetical protein CBR_g50692 [Chara braunii]